MNDQLEEHLARIERILDEILERLKLLEDLIARGDEEARIALEAYRLTRAPIQRAIQVASKTVRALDRLSPYAREDMIYRAIIEVLAANGPQSLRGLERGVRRLVGRASRNTIRRKLGELEEAGVVRVERRGRQLVISLAEEKAGSTKEDTTGGTSAS
ncbi:MAG: hypothetical protein GSR78_00540 [Desulfurococcales archaeon]|nr:hypothetical protein [Desulfurococcales archaeon]